LDEFALAVALVVVVAEHRRSQLGRDGYAVPALAVAVADLVCAELVALAVAGELGRDAGRA